VELTVCDAILAPVSLRMLGVHVVEPGFDEAQLVWLRLPAMPGQRSLLPALLSLIEFWSRRWLPEVASSTV
jgi:hypothetical protein